MNTGRSAAWDALYASGKARMDYPSEHLVRLVARVLDPERDARVLDLGFGSGNNLLHLLRQGFDVSGVEISSQALEITRDRIQAEGYAADLHLLKQDRLPFDAQSMDVVISWFVLDYNDEAGLVRTLAEIQRVLNEGGRLLATLVARDDDRVSSAAPVGDSMFRMGSEIDGQGGILIWSPQDERHIGEMFEGFSKVEIGWFGWWMGGVRSSHWVVDAVL